MGVLSMYKKKRGFTLVETSVYLSILSIVIAIFIQGFSFLKTIKDNIIIEKDINKIHSFLTLGKSISKEKEIRRRISYNKNENLLFYEIDSSDEKIEKIILSESLENVKIESINGKAGSLLIDKKGSITTPCTITIKDSRGVEHKITINIGGGTIDVKE